MRSQVTCPSCQTPFMADIYQIIDVGLEPALKYAFLNGQLNTIQCPNCRAVTQVRSPILYHDPEHEQFMVYVPMEMQLSQADQEKLIGQLVQRAMDQLPAEQRRGYMLQPQTMLSLQSLMEQVLETEGITSDVIARQQAKSDLLREMLSADGESVDKLIEENQEQIDDEFFALLRALMDASEQSEHNQQSLKLVNLQARLYRNSDFGRKLERQQIAMRQFSRDVKKEGGLTPALLLKHVLQHKRDDHIVGSLVAAGQQAFNYEFFIQLSDRIEKREKKGIDANELIALREQLLELQQEMERRSKEILEGAQNTLVEILKSEDRVAALKRNLGKIDDAFLYVLSVRLQQARNSGDQEQEKDLKGIQDQIIEIMEEQAPPELRIINQLLRADDEKTQDAILSDNGQLVNEELLAIVEAMLGEANESGDDRLRDRLNEVHRLIKARV